MKAPMSFTFMGNEVPVYTEGNGYGFVQSSCAIPTRYVPSSKIKLKSECCLVQAEQSNELEYDELKEGKKLENATRYNLGGMIFRVKLPAGAYEIEVETTRGAEETLLAVSGMRGTAILNTGYWDAASLVPIKHYATWENKTWKYQYVNGQEYIDIEIEPKQIGVEIGVKSISIKALPVKEVSRDNKPSVFILGDSTVKSYVFEEAPMCGWGQLLSRYFDLNQVQVTNYSAGGRSLKVMYFEGRLNDILLTGKPGDYILVQSGHNDERDTFEEGETARFGRGLTEEMYRQFLEEIYLPAIKAREMIPILVTPMTRVGEGASYDGRFHNSFNNRRFPEIMKQVASQYQIPLIDLNARSVTYINEVGKEGAEAIVLSIEAGETPGKTNSGSFANGNPNGKIDGTHMKEALAKSYARIVIEELYRLVQENQLLYSLNKGIKQETKEAITSGDWARVHPEQCQDILSGKNAYYRNQIEKMVELNVLEKDEAGCFRPKEVIEVNKFAKALRKLYQLSDETLKCYRESDGLTREKMGVMLLEAYQLKFKNQCKPVYMTAYNGTNITPDHPQYDPNLIGEEAQYYPVVGYEALEDLQEITEIYKEDIKEAYYLGLIRSEQGIERGKMANGKHLEPKKLVTREKAAKALYFMWVLCHEIEKENHSAEL